MTPSKELDAACERTKARFPYNEDIALVLRHVADLTQRCLAAEAKAETAEAKYADLVDVTVDLELARRALAAETREEPSEP